MTWRKHFRMVQVSHSPVPQQQTLVNSGNSRSAGSSTKYSSYLPEVYAGHPNRLQRYMQYDDMDRDSEINAALDTIADFCTQSEEQNDKPFEIKYDESANETEVKLIKTTLDKWIKINDFKSRLWYMFRGVIKNGDQFFVRDPETKEWIWVDHYNVELVKVDETAGRKPIEYIIKDLDFIKQGKLGTKPSDPNDYQSQGGNMSPLSRGPVSGSSSNGGGGEFQLAGSGSNPRNANGAVQRSSAVDAEHVIHLSLSVGMDPNWPFGSSVLESIFKTFKQKELLEDSVIIYRTQRAPERRIFKIDVGSMNPMMANAHIERIKNEIHQRRIPNRSGGGSSMMDAAYNPISMMEDYFFAQGLDGRGSSVETLPGGDQLGEITDLEFFNQKLRAGLRIPPAYMANGADGGASYNDGKIGAAMIQEYKFNKYCMRLQSLLTPMFDSEFKKFVKSNGITIDEDLFELTFNPPQNFAKYRQVELDAAQMSVYTQIADNKKLSERFKFKRYLNLTQEEILENETLWLEENPSKAKKATGASSAESSQGGALSDVGISSNDDPFGDDSAEVVDDVDSTEVDNDEVADIDAAFPEPEEN